MKHLYAKCILFVIGGAVLLAIAPGEPRAAEPVAQGPGGAGMAFRIPREPTDVDPKDPEASLSAFDEYCWESFLALNTTASEGSRGEVARGMGLARPGEATVWMAWRSRDDLFPAGACRKPLDWEADPGGKGPEAPQGHTLSHVAKIVTVLDVNLPGDDLKTFIGPVIAQDGEYLRFEIRYNRAAYQHIVDRELWDWRHLPALGEVPDDFPAGSIVVKAAWRVIGEGEADLKERYFWTTARLLDPFRPGTVLRDATVGLVGLHVVHKTPKRPQWIWSSFEHVDNVPDAQGPVAGRRYALNYGAGYRGDPPPNVDANPPRGQAPGIPIAVASLEQEGHLRPTQVVRVNPVHPKTEETNRRYQARLAGTVWRNYKLVVTQFPTRPNADDAEIPGDPFPGEEGAIPGGADKVSVANTVMETYVQGTSCMKCHAKARHYGVSFMFSPGRSLLCLSQPSEPAKDPIAQPERPKGDVDGIVDRHQALDRKVLDELYQKLTPQHDGDGVPRAGDPPRDPGTSAPPCGTDVSRPDVRPDGPGDEDDAGDFAAVRKIFSDAIQAWRAKNGGTCDPEITKRHGTAFGWKDGRPWRTWDELRAARFAPPGSKPQEGVPLLDEKAATAREMLLIRVLRGEGVPQARGKRMPLNGPYIGERHIETIENYIARRMRKPVS